VSKANGRETDFDLRIPLEMKTIDLTQPLREGMPVYPGTEPPRLEVGCSITEHGFAEKRLSFFSHTGTHIDAPSHLLAKGKSLD